MPRRSLLALALAAGATGCSTAPPEHFTRLWLEGRTGSPIVGTSTEDGVLLLARPEWQTGDVLEIQFPFGNSLVVDKGRIDRLNDTLAVVRPLTARLREGRFAGSLPVAGEPLYLALRDERDEPLMQPAQAWRDGAYGDWLVLPEHDATTVARRYAGSGVYVLRSDRWEIVGLLAGLTAQDESDPRGEVALGFIGLPEMARILPDRLDIFARDLRPLRPDFEFGVPLQPGDIVIEEPVEEEAGAEPAPIVVPKAGPAPGAKPKPKPKPGTPRH